MRPYSNLSPTTIENRLFSAEKALMAIRNMGRVCEEFELCMHPSCNDSCAATLTALDYFDRIRKGEL